MSRRIRSLTIKRTSRGPSVSEVYSLFESYPQAVDKSDGWTSFYLKSPEDRKNRKCVAMESARPNDAWRRALGSRRADTLLEGVGLFLGLRGSGGTLSQVRGVAVKKKMRALKILSGLISVQKIKGSGIPARNVSQFCPKIVWGAGVVAAGLGPRVGGGSCWCEGSRRAAAPDEIEERYGVRGERSGGGGRRGTRARDEVERGAAGTKLSETTLEGEEKASTAPAQRARCEASATERESAAPTEARSVPPGRGGATERRGTRRRERQSERKITRRRGGGDERWGARSYHCRGTPKARRDGVAGGRWGRGGGALRSLGRGWVGAERGADALRFSCAAAASGAGIDEAASNF